MVSFLERIKFITNEFGPRIAGSNADRKTTQYLEKEFRKFTSNVEIESFEVVGRSLLNLISFIVWVYFISVISYLLLPLISLGLLILLLIVYYLALFKDKNFVDLFARKKVSRNVIATIPSKKDSIGIIILSGHHDSTYHMPMLQKEPKLALLVQNGVLLGIIVLLLTSIWKSIIFGFPKAGLIELFEYSIGTLRIDWFVFPDVFFLLALFDLFIFFYFLRNMVTRTEIMGANDNLSAVVLLQALGEHLQNDPLENWEVRLIAFGAEEPGRIGSRTYVKNHLLELDKAININYDEVGSGKNLGLVVEETYINVKHDEDFVELIQKLAKNGGFKLKAIKTGFGFTDASSFTRRNIKATTIFCYGGKSVTHSLEDTVENIDEESIQNAFNLSKALLKEIDKLERI